MTNTMLEPLYLVMYALFYSSKTVAKGVAMILFTFTGKDSETYINDGWAHSYPASQVTAEGLI